MFELEGKYGKAKVFTDVVDNASISQVITLLNQPYAENANVRMMPDIHAGACIALQAGAGDCCCRGQMPHDRGGASDAQGLLSLAI